LSADWTRRPEGGSRFAIRLLRRLALGAGRAPTRLLLLPITLYFLLRRGPERRAARAYLTRVLGRPARLIDVARLIHRFAGTILDRVYLLGEQFRRFEVSTHGLDALHAAMDHGRGVLLVGSHLGSFESLRVLSLQRPEVSVRVVIDVAQNAAITEAMAALNPAVAAAVIDARQDGTAIVFAIKAALDAQALVTLLADRARPGEAAQRAEFLGAPAPFPTAPWLIAAALKVPVVLCFGLYRGGKRYELHFETFADELSIERRGREAALAAILARYAARLEHYTRYEPWNWFNFYDFWQSDARADAAAGVPAAVGSVRRT
jgi:predicted LPLAT superfamily acyltransferase